MTRFQVRSLGAGIPITVTEPRQMWVQEWSFQVYAKVICNNNVGWGEALPAALNSVQSYTTMIDGFANVVEKEDSENIRRVWEKMEHVSFSGGYGIAIGAMSAIDIALWDLKARERKISLESLLGNSQGKTRRYASLPRYHTSGDVLKVVTDLVNNGYSMIKIHQTKDDTIETMRVIRETLGYGPSISLDMNCALRYEEARKFVESVSKYEPLWIEEPLWPHDDYYGLSKLNRIWPMAGGENEYSINQFHHLLDSESLTYFQPDVAKVGGITPLLDLISLFKAYGVEVAFHNRPHNGWVSTMASVAASIGTNVDAWIETPPFGIPEQFFHFNGVMDSKFIEPRGNGISLEPKEPLPKVTNSSPLDFHTSVK